VTAKRSLFDRAPTPPRCPRRKESGPLLPRTNYHSSYFMTRRPRFHSIINGILPDTSRDSITNNRSLWHDFIPSIGKLLCHFSSTGLHSDWHFSRFQNEEPCPTLLHLLPTSTIDGTSRSLPESARPPAAGSLGGVGPLVGPRPAPSARKALSRIVNFAGCPLQLEKIDDSPVPDARTYGGVAFTTTSLPGSSSTAIHRPCSNPSNKFSVEGLPGASHIDVTAPFGEFHKTSGSIK